MIIHSIHGRLKKESVFFWNSGSVMIIWVFQAMKMVGFFILFFFIFSLNYYYIDLQWFISICIIQCNGILSNYSRYAYLRFRFIFIVYFCYMIYWFDYYIYLGTPFFKHISIDVGDNKNFSIIANNLCLIYIIKKKIMFSLNLSWR
jgi:hypothetical protein